MAFSSRFGRQFGRMGHMTPGQGGGEDPPPLTGLVYYVSPSAGATQDGSQTHPFATLEQARQAIRTVTSRLSVGGPPSGGWTGASIVLMQGTHARTEVFELDSRDSGTVSHPLVIRADPEATSVLLSGAVSLDGQWTEVTPGSDSWAYGRIPAASKFGEGRSKVFRATVPAGQRGAWGPNIDSFVNMVRLVDQGRLRLMSRYPNGDYAEAGAWMRPLSSVYTAYGQNASITVSGSVPQSIDFATQSAMVCGTLDGQDGNAHHTWEEVSAVTNVSGNSRLEITPSLANHAIVTNGFSFVAIRNVIEHLADGTYAYQPDTGLIYYWSPTGAAPVGASFTLLQDLVSLATWGNTWNGAVWAPSDRYTVGSEADHVTFFGLTMGDVRSRVVHGGWNTGITFDSCAVRNAGMIAIDLIDQTDCCFRNGSVKWAANVGLRIHGGDLATMTPSGTIVEDNLLEELTFDPRSTIMPGVDCGRTTWIPYFHNDGAKSRSSVGFTFRRNTCRRFADSGFGLPCDAVVEDNTFEDSGSLVADNGFIGNAADWWSVNVLIRRNTFRRIRQNPMALASVPTIPVYVDWLHDWTIEDNRFEDCPCVAQFGGKFVRFRRNVMVRCGNNHYLSPILGIYRRGMMGWYDGTPGVSTENAAGPQLDFHNIDWDLEPWSTTYSYLRDYIDGLSTTGVYEEPAGARYDIRMWNEGVEIRDNVLSENYHPYLFRYPQDEYFHTWNGYSIGYNLTQQNYPVGTYVATPTVGGGTQFLSDAAHYD